MKKIIKKIRNAFGILFKILFFFVFIILFSISSSSKEYKYYLNKKEKKNVKN